MDDRGWTDGRTYRWMTEGGQMGRHTDGQQRVENLSHTPHLAKICVTKKVHYQNLL